MTGLVYVEAVLPREDERTFEYCIACARMHRASECKSRGARVRQLRGTVAQLRQELADLSGEPS